MNTSVPAQLRAGDTWRWQVDYPDYPAPTWTLTFRFVNGSQNPDEIVCSAVGTQHLAEVAASATAEYSAGRYRWFARAEQGAEVQTIADGLVEVLPDPAGDAPFDIRGQARILLDAVNAALLRKATTDQLAMSLNGRSISRYSLAELAQWREKLRAEVRDEEGTSNGGKGRDILVRVRRG